MFGNKAEKRERLTRVVDLVIENPGITQAELARRLQVNRSTVLRDLIKLSELGVRLAQDERGGLYLLE
jgi:DeoR/GlpR family transcriptional regulator of sugar metabolism